MKDMQSMNAPRTRAEFERNFNLLHRQIKEGRFHLPRDYPLDSMLRVRFLPNGRLDFLSVDEMARSNANTLAHFSDDRILEQLQQQRSTDMRNDQEPCVTPDVAPPDQPPDD